MPVGIYKHHPHQGFQKGKYIPWNKGIKTGKRSDEFREKMKKIVTGRKASKKTREKISEAQTGKHPSKETLKKKRLSAKRGKDSNFWKGGLMQDKDYQSKKVNIHSANRRARKSNAIGAFTLKEWEELKRKFNYTCLKCGRKEPQIKLTKDHIIPLTSEGTNFISNIQPLCMGCNRKKSTKTVNLKGGK